MRKAVTVLCVCYGLFAAPVCAEKITLRTWYPSPYGSYKRMAVTDLVAAGTEAAPLNVTGGIAVDGKFILVPQNCAATLSPTLGQVCLDSADGYALKVFHGGQWQRVGGDTLLGTVYKSYAMNNSNKLNEDKDRAFLLSGIGPVPAEASYAKVSIDGHLVINYDKIKMSYYLLPIRINMTLDLVHKKSAGVFMRGGDIPNNGTYETVYSWENVRFGTPLTEKDIKGKAFVYNATGESSGDYLLDSWVENFAGTCWINVVLNGDSFQIQVPGHANFYYAAYLHTYTLTTATYLVQMDFYKKGA